MPLSNILTNFNPMETSITSRILSFLAFFIIFIIIRTLLVFSFEDLTGAYLAVVSAVLTAVLAPRIYVFKTQSGTQHQLKWIVFKKSISI